jgi:succinate-semialdehyde dehydrogenase/glutarate-semialdehyde dehydrogenase
MAEHHRMFVDGEWIEAADGGTFAVSDPATGEVIASVADGGPA